MTWARSRIFSGLLPVAFLAAVPATSSGAAEPRPAVDLDRMAQRGTHFVAPTRAGAEAELTLDSELQQIATKLLDSANPVRGGMVVLDAHSGKVLVWAESARDGQHHHVLSTARVPAASVFKLVTTAALFETTTLSPKEPVCISGGMHGIERRHLDPPHGDAIECAPFHYAIGYSKNAVFAQLATHRLLRSDLIDTARALGFNGQVPFELEVPMGKLEVPYGDLEFARTAAGFQGSTLSPLGGAYLASVIAHGGEATQIRVSEAPSPGPDDDSAPVIGRVLKPLTAERIRRMMEVTVRSGTCHHAFSDENGRPYLGSIRVSGKTGTLRPEANEGMTSWFIGFAPSHKPEIIVSVMLENGTVWRRKANELARDFMRSYFHGHGRAWVSDPFAAAEPTRVVSLNER
ncbi:MAG TPA: penicillin-binding transpeptidase domain-containing protein [Polyangiaceae bacterium]|jgi:peptidoglycan glycosyltransferase|nr:penicillin-binding transpeptidase domain-containing protein [Polyangiaceae bacterium]